MFADKYIEKNNLGEVLIKTKPHPELGIIVVIPCFNEPDIIKALESLNKSLLPTCKTEVIVLINHADNSSEEIKTKSLNTYNKITDWIKNIGNREIVFCPIQPVALPEKWAGVGLARKKGMDEAARRFNLLNKPGGLVVSLDADTLVKENYLVEIENHFLTNPRHVGATISFKHQTKGLNEKNRQGILLYERYLKYYKEALTFSGYPNSIYTIGSAFVVTADAYVKRGGMNRRKAGEDFYFLQNLTQQGEVGEITSTEIYPSARLSDRVPFGTGASMKKWMEGREDLTKTYNFQAFADLKFFFNKKEKLFGIPESEFQNLLETLPLPVSSFLKEDQFYNQLNELNKNCSSLKVFNHRFYQIFNAFKILKFLNYTHPKFYQRVDLMEQVRILNQSSQM